MNSCGLKPQQQHPSTVCISDGICWPLTCFMHNLRWWARRLVHTGDDSASSYSPKRLDVKKLRDEKFEGVNAFPRELLGTCDIYLFPPHNDSLNPSGIMESLAECQTTRNKCSGVYMQSNLLERPPQGPKVVAFMKITRQKSGLLSSKPGMVLPSIFK